MAHPFPGTHTYGPTYELVLGMMHETGFPTLLHTAERVELVVGSDALNKQNEMDMDLTKLVMDLNLKIEFRVYSG